MRIEWWKMRIDWSKNVRCKQIHKNPAEMQTDPHTHVPNRQTNHKMVLHNIYNIQAERQKDFCLLRMVVGYWMGLHLYIMLVLHLTVDSESKFLRLIIPRTGSQLLCLFVDCQNSVRTGMLCTWQMFVYDWYRQRSLDRIIRNAFLCIFSKHSLWALDKPQNHAGDAYSSVGLTYCKYTVLKSLLWCYNVSIGVKNRLF